MAILHQANILVGKDQGIVATRAPLDYLGTVHGGRLEDNFGLRIIVTSIVLDNGQLQCVTKGHGTFGIRHGHLSGHVDRSDFFTLHKTDIVSVQGLGS